MAKTRIEIKGKKNPSQLYIRFYHSKQFDFSAKTGIFINPYHWSNTSQRFKSLAEVIPDKDLINNRIEELKSKVISEYNRSYSTGEIITKNWLQNLIDKANNRPTDENDIEVFFVSFIEDYIDKSKTRVNPDTGKAISERTIRKYNTTLSRLKEYENLKGIKLKHIDIGLDFFEGFVSYLSIEGGYKATTMNKYISQIKMFCREIKTKGYKINPEFENKRFNVKRNDTIDTYLNKEEINRIFDLEIKDDRLEKIRDLFIVGLWTGLRVSDLTELDRIEIEGDNFLISETIKTNVPIRIPIHHQVKQILNKRGGELPKFDLTAKSLENLFNKKIKEICEKAGITQKIIGDIKDMKTNRDVRGIYPKYKLVSSHTCRRSFVTNHLGILPDKAIMTITGHKSSEMLHKYNKKSSEDYLEQVRKHWEKENTKLKVV